MVAVIPGDPASLRAAAGQLRACAQQAQDAARLTTTAMDLAAGGGWAGAAREAFMGATASTGARVSALARFTDAAVALETYANELEPLQRAQNDAMTAWRAAGGDGVGPINPQAQAAASQAMVGLPEQARAANERAARAIEAVAPAAQDESQGALDFAKAVDSSAGVSAAWAEQQGGLMNRILTGGGGFNAAPAGGAAGAWSDVAAAGKVGGVVGGSFFAGYGQYLDDQSNPHYSVGERAGRVAGQTLTVGGAAAAGGAIGAGVGSIVPGVGTVVGGVIGLGVGALTGYFSGEYVDEVNDDVVDGAGEFGDLVGEEVKDISSW